MKTDEFQLYGDWEENTERRYVGLLAHDRHGRMLMQLRDDLEGVTGGGKWGIFGGEIEAGETPLEAIIREAEEEIGIRFAAADLKPDARYLSEGSRYQFYIYLVKRRVEPHEIRLGEGAGFAFLNKHQVMELDIAISVRDLARGHVLSWKN